MAARSTGKIDRYHDQYCVDQLRSGSAMIRTSMFTLADPISGKRTGVTTGHTS